MRLGLRFERVHLNIVKHHLSLSHDTQARARISLGEREHLRTWTVRHSRKTLFRGRVSPSDPDEKRTMCPRRTGFARTRNTRPWSDINEPITTTLAGLNWARAKGFREVATVPERQKVGCMLVLYSARWGSWDATLQYNLHPHTHHTCLLLHRNSYTTVGDQDMIIGHHRVKGALGPYAPASASILGSLDVRYRTAKLPIWGSDVGSTGSRPASRQ